MEARKIGESAKFSVYLHTLDDGRDVISKGSKTFEDGDVLAREAGKFTQLAAFAEEVARSARRLGKKDPKYNWLFAKLICSDLEPAIGDRRINVYEMPGIEPDKLIPMAKLKARTEIDARTSAWILGRLYKFYSFFELFAAARGLSFSEYPLFSPSDYLIGPARHRLIYYNFSGDRKDAIANDFVRAVAKFMLGWVAHGDDAAEQKYYELLQDFAKSGRRSFEKAHAGLYGLVEELWGFKYYPFTYRDRGTLVWKTIKEE